MIIIQTPDAIPGVKTRFIKTGELRAVLPELVLRKTGYQVAILPIQPVLIRKIGLVAKDKNSLPIASKYFIDLLFKRIADLP